jgi:ketosteroid isomerase-like protein
MRASRHRVAGWAVFALALSLAAPPAARAQGESDTAKKEIQAALDQCWKCVEAKDIEGYGKVLATDYRRIDYFGDATDREKSIVFIRTMVEPADDLHTTATVENIRMKGDDATVLVRLKGRANTKNRDGKVVPVSWDQREAQVWRKTPDGWRLRDSMGLTESVLVDGKPYYPETSDQAAAARTAIQSVYNGLVRAAVEGNTEAVRKVIPAGFVDYPEPGASARTRDEFLSKLRDELGDKNGPADFKLERAMLSGDKAIVLGTVRVENTATVNGQPVKTTTTTWHRDVWQKSADGTWQPVEFRPVLREKSVGGKIGSAIFAPPDPRP